MEETETKRLLFMLVLAILMVTSGSINTLSAKWADNLKVDGKRFNHPFLQAICMFAGELFCLFAFLIVHFIKTYRWKRSLTLGLEGQITDLDFVVEPKLPKFNIFIFIIPACCDILSTCITYTGLNLTQASSFQMLRGAVIVFTGLLSVAFLRSRFHGFKWLGMGFVTVGLIIVGVSDIIFDTNPNDDLNGIITGDLLIIMAQIITATQMVVEQKFLMKYDIPPLLVVGLEGLFGITILSFLLIPMYYIHVPATFSKNPFHRMEDIFEAFREMQKNPLIIVALSVTTFSIAFFNFAGVSVTKEFSATTRMVLDSVRTLVIWMVSIPLFDQKFIPFQILGFLLLILGMFVYNDIIIGPYMRSKVIPKLSEWRIAPFCLSFWGIDLPRASDLDSLVDEPVDDEN